MRKIICGLLTVLFIVTAFTDIPVSAQTAETQSDFRAVWVSSISNLDFPSKSGLSNEEIKKEINVIIDRAVDQGLNALMVQVRPSADALYRSSYFPWSKTLTGTQGVAPADNFDPLTYWIEQSHQKGLELHAWINPFRISNVGQNITNVNQLSSSHPARMNPTWAISYKNALYFDPGRPECRQLIANGVAEIVRGYDVDGIHLDDYFYPDSDFPDSTMYKTYGSGQSLDDWRRGNVNELIRLIQNTIRNINPDVRFGVSPAAIWQNASSDPRGSDTRGYETYKSAYADTRRWVKEGWLDYICPQIYWYIGYEIADYEKVLTWWEDVCSGTGVDLYIGHAAYREDAQTENWTGEIVRQLQRNALSSVVKGSVFFRSGSLKGGVGEQIKRYYTQAASVPTVSPSVATPTPAATPMPTPVIPLPIENAPYVPNKIMDKLTVAQPSTNVSVNDAEGYNILGTCDPNKPLYVNGKLVENRTVEGFFSIYMPLKKGENSFTFKQDGQSAITRTVTVKTAAVTPAETMKTPSVNKAFPTGDEYVSSGDIVTLKCTAPSGAKVTARFNGETISLKQGNAYESTASTIYAATYSAEYHVSKTATGIFDLGKPTYNAEFKGKTYTATANESVKLIGTDAAYYATVTADSTWLYPKSTTTGGSSWLLVKGQKDRITAVTGGGDWVKLACGAWVEGENIKRASEDRLPVNTLSGADYQSIAYTDTIKWKTETYSALNVQYDGKQLTVKMGLQRDVPAYNISLTTSMFSTVSVGTDNGTPYYTFTMKEGAKLDGYYVSYVNGELCLNLKKRRSLSISDKPLTGFTIVIDAGHGDTDSGALGPMGNVIAEKDVNLSNANKLSARLTNLGATVVAVRSTDVYYTLNERTEINRKANPDMFISLHANSVDATTDASNIRGLTVWYRNPGSMALADTLTTSLFRINPITTRRANSNQSNFYVCRPSLTPSVIIEASFMCNIDDFAWMINDSRQNELAEGIANAILAYYGKTLSGTTALKAELKAERTAKERQWSGYVAGNVRRNSEPTYMVM